MSVDWWKGCKALCALEGRSDTLLDDGCILSDYCWKREKKNKQERCNMEKPINTEMNTNEEVIDLKKTI